MERRHRPLVGRDGLLGDLRAAVADGGFTVLCGTRGSGRTAVLAELADSLRADGVPVLRVGLAGTEPWDTLGAGALLRALDELARRGAPATVAPAVKAVREGYASGTYSSPGGRARLLDDMTRVFAHVAERRAVVVIDDSEQLPQVTTAAAAVAAAGHPVVAAMPSLAPRGLPYPVRHAYRRLEVPALGDDDTLVLLRQLCGRTPSLRLSRDVAGALGPLAGNPGALAGIVSRLREEGRLVTVRGRVHVPDREPVRLPRGHWLVRAVTEMDPAAVDLLLLAGKPAGVAVADIARLAAVAGCGVSRMGGALDALTSAGVLTVSDGRAEVLCAAVSAAVAADRDGRRRFLHRKAAEALMDAKRRGDPFDEDEMAEHLAQAGPAAGLPAGCGQRLLEAAERDAPRNPERAIRWLRLLREPPSWPAAPGRAQELLMRLAVRSGDYRRLGDIARETVTGPCAPAPGVRRRAAAAAALAAVHTGVPVPAATRAALGEEPLATGAVGLSDRWLAGEAPALAEFRRCFRPLAHEEPGAEEEGRRGWWSERTLERLLDARFPVPALAVVLGADYGPAADGFLADYGRVLTGYVDGVWDDALDAAHELFARPGGDPRAREIAALNAAEMTLWRDGERRAGGWLNLAGSEPAYPQLAAWARAGQALRAHQYEQVLSIASEPPVTAGEPAGHLAVRAAIAAALHGTGRVPAPVLNRIRERAEAAAGADETSADARAIVTALLDGDGPGACAAAERARSRRSSPYLPWAYLAAGLAGPEAGPWLAEAHAAADARGAVRLRTWIRRLMSERGLRLPPSADGPGDEFSAREVKIIGQVRQGRTNRQIASLLALSEKTVEGDLARLFGRTGARSRQQLAASASRASARTRPHGMTGI